MSKLAVNATSRVQAGVDLFKIDPDSKLLSSEMSALFHTIVASLLYLSLSVRPDLLVSLLFYVLVFKASTEEDMNKLKQVLKYLSYTKDLSMCIGQARSKFVCLFNSLLRC